jgi:hypothetical protein
MVGESTSLTTARIACRFSGGVSSRRCAPATYSENEGSVRQALTTKADHNGTRRGPIPADAPRAQPQVNDCPRQPGRILQAGVASSSLASSTRQNAIHQDHEGFT